MGLLTALKKLGTYLDSHHRNAVQTVLRLRTADAPPTVELLRAEQDLLQVAIFSVQVLDLVAALGILEEAATHGEANTIPPSIAHAVDAFDAHALMFNVFNRRPSHRTVDSLTDLPTELLAYIEGVPEQVYFFSQAAAWLEEYNTSYGNTSWLSEAEERIAQIAEQAMLTAVEDLLVLQDYAALMQQAQQLIAEKAPFNNIAALLN